MMNCVSVLCVLLVTSYLSNVEGCSCFRETNEEKFCRARFVLKGKLLDKTNAGLKIKYQVKVLNSFKFRQGQNVIIETPRDSAACGVHLMTGDIYILSGSITRDGRYETNSCWWYQSWQYIPNNTQSKLMRGTFGNCKRFSEIINCCIWK